MDHKKYKDAREGIVAWVVDCLTRDTEPRGFLTHITAVDQEDQGYVYCFLPPEDDAPDRAKIEYMNTIGKALAVEVTAKNRKEVFYIHDRLTLPEQGSSYDSVVTIYHWTVNVGWECGAIEYNHVGEFRIAPVVWDDPYWSNRMKQQLQMVRLVPFTSPGARAGKPMTLADFVNLDWDFPKEQYNA